MSFLPLVGQPEGAGISLILGHLDDATTADGGLVLSEAAATALTSVHRHVVEVVVHPGDEVHSVVEQTTWVSTGDALVTQTTRLPQPDDPEHRERRSVTVPVGISGQVRAVHDHGTSPGVQQRLTIEIGWTRAAEVGDTIQPAEGEAVLVTEIRPSLPGSAQGLWSQPSGTCVLHKVSCAADLLAHRGCGPLGSFTRMPVRGDGHPPQRVLVRDLRTALHAGAPTVCEEWTRAKADAPQARRVLHEGSSGADAAVPPEVPEAVHRMQSILGALALDVDPEAGCPALMSMDADRIRRRAPGEVLKPETLNHRTLVPERHGLFCEEVFGARGQDQRRRQLGRVELAVPLVHPLFEQDVADRLGLSRSDLARVIAYEASLEPDGDGFRVSDRDWSRLEDSGGFLIRRCLGDVGEAHTWVVDAWPVLPAGLRPLVPLSGGRWAASDLNDLYRRLVNRNRRLTRLLELNAPLVINCNEGRMLAESLACVVDNRPGKITGPNRRPLKSLADLLAELRGSLLTKPVDFSGRAAVVPDPQLPDDRCAVPESMVAELFDPWPDRPALLAPADPDADPALFTCEVQPTTGSALRTSPWVARALGRVAVVHVPITTEAAREARSVLRDAPPPPKRRTAGGWIRSLLGATDPLEALRRAAVSGAPDTVSDPLTKLILGRSAHG